MKQKLCSIALLGKSSRDTTREICRPIFYVDEVKQHKSAQKLNIKLKNYLQGNGSKIILKPQMQQNIIF